ncbi:MAG: hypothetical protein IKM06_04115 [Clostridia bacterium]|nr:hypothetical protein [Clostridia bacterium]
MELKDKNILIISPFFFDYHLRIKEALEARGANVDVVDEQPSHSAVARILMRKDAGIYHGVINRYFDKVLTTLKKDYDFILFIKCEAPTVEVLKKFKRRFPFAKRILYLWDSVQNITHITKKFAYFNKIFSFDNDDVKRYSFLEYAYWGYTKEFDVPSDERYEYDLAFIGTLHSIRPKVLDEISRQCKEYGLVFYKFVYVPHILVFLYNKLMNPYFVGVKKAKIHFKAMSTQRSIEIYKKSKAVLEIENTYQSGATTRLGEMIGMQKKIVTTHNCTNQEFYNENNQLVIDVNNIEINKRFFETPYVPVPSDVRYKYSFEHFIDKVFK